MPLQGGSSSHNVEEWQEESVTTRRNTQHINLAIHIDKKHVAKTLKIKNFMKIW